MITITVRPSWPNDAHFLTRRPQLLLELRQDAGQAVRGLAREDTELQLPVQALVFQHGVGEIAHHPSAEAFHFLVGGVRGGAADEVDGVRVAVALAEVGDGAEGEHALVHDSGSVCQGFGFFHGMGLEGARIVS